MKDASFSLTIYINQYITITITIYIYSVFLLILRSKEDFKRNILLSFYDIPIYGHSLAEETPVPEVMKFTV